MRFRGLLVEPGAGPFVFGILNVTPDSFSDGGDYLDADDAIGAGCRMAEAGADVIDVGGESTKPGSTYVSADEQIRRTQPVIAGLAERFGSKGPAISIDTRLAEVARAAADAGASVVNDVSALRDDSELAKLVADRGLGIVLMHMKRKPADMQVNPFYDDVIAEIREFLAERINAAVQAGIPRERIIIDPGIGFGKTTQHNLQILRHVGSFRELGVPVLIGPSRKRFIGDVLGIDSPRDRLMGTLAAVSVSVLAGVEGIRVHDVAECRQIVDMCKAIRQGSID